MFLIQLRNFIIGWFIVLSIYHILIYAGRRKDYLNLIFAIQCIAVIFYCISAYLYYYYPEHINYVFFILLNYFLNGLITIIVYFIFKLKKTKIFIFLTVYYSFLTVLIFSLILFSYIIGNKYIINFYFLPVAVYCLIYFFLLVFHYFKKKKQVERRESIIIFGFLILIIFYVAYCVLLFARIKIPLVIGTFILFIKSLFISFAITDSCNMEHKKLQDLNITLEKKVKKRTNELKEAHKQRITFFTNLAHETKTPLTLITNYLDKDIKKRGLSKDISVVKQNIDKLIYDMDNYLVLEKLEAGNIIHVNNNLKESKDMKNEKSINKLYQNTKPFNIHSAFILKEEKYQKDRYTIMIVEDNLDMLYYLQENLYDTYNVFISKNGREALEKINSIPIPDLIISDVMMDELNGFDFYDELVKDQKYKSIPFIFLTAKTLEKEKIKGLKKGAVDYIYKPFLMDELINKIKSILIMQRKYKNDNIEKLCEKFNEMIIDDLEEKNNAFDFSIISDDYQINHEEKKIIQLLVDGQEYKDISSVFNISKAACGKRINNIYKKLGVHNKIELFNKLKFK